MVKLAERNLCTGCGACAYKCPKQCISMHEDSVGVILPSINYLDCIDCHSCEKVCPIINPVEFYEPLKAYAAWSSNDEERTTSASGGIASEIYRCALDRSIYIAGAVQNSDFSVTMEVCDSEQGIQAFKNSKYVFSSAYTLYPQIKSIISCGQKIVVVGLPCQIAALRKIFKNNKNLMLVDVVCHGTTPLIYLQQHISKIEKEYKAKAHRMSFRDPVMGTMSFTFTLYDEYDNIFYLAPDGVGDNYQEGYHRMISYRENCYHCIFAQRKRCSDLTISDYKGLGRIAPCSFTNKKVSSVLVNTEIGKTIIDSLLLNKQIVALERPVDEPISGDPQLQRPSIKSRKRRIFEKNIRVTPLNFDRTMERVEMINRKWRVFDLTILLINRAINKFKRFI